MITTVLKKSTSINYFIVGILMFVFFLIFQISVAPITFSVIYLLEKVAIFFLILVSFFLTDFIVKKNVLTTDSGFCVFFFFFFLLFFPQVLNDYRLLISNFFVLIALRRLMSMANPVKTKQKIFDASLWVFVASIFHFWSILFLILVFISILLTINRDYRNWFLPFVGFFTVTIIFLFFSILIDESLIIKYLESCVYDYRFDYFENIYQNLLFSIFITTTLFFISFFISTLSRKPKAQNSSYFKLFVWIIISFVIYSISADKSNSLLVFAFAPLSIFATDFLETNTAKWQKEIVFLTIFFLGLFGFVSQL